MAKKFGKFLLCTAAIGTAVAAAYYYMRKKDTACTAPEDDDYDDFSEDLEDDMVSSHSYVPLKNEGKAADASESDMSGEADPSGEEGFVPLAEHAAQAADILEKAADHAETTVEEFFDEDDSPDEEPPISDN